MSARREQKRSLAIVLALIAAAALVVACVGQHWLVSPLGGDSSIGLLRVQVCEDGECKSMSNFQLIDELRKVIEDMKRMNSSRRPGEQFSIPPEPWGGFPVVGLLTILGSLLAAGGLVHGAILAIRRRRPELTIMPTTIAVLGLALAIINGCLVVATKPEMVQDMSVGWSFWTFGVGAVLGLAAVFPLNRQIRPIDEELGAASATMSWGGSRDDQ